MARENQMVSKRLIWYKKGNLFVSNIFTSYYWQYVRLFMVPSAVGDEQIREQSVELQREPGSFLRNNLICQKWL